MLDTRIQAVLRPSFNAIAQGVVKLGITANAVSVLGFAIGMAAAFAIGTQHYWWGAALIALSRLCDGLDGAIARATEPTDFGGFLDISLDFLFYAAIPLAFAYANPDDNALSAATLLLAFMGTGSSFLAYAVIAEKRKMHSAAYPDKSFYFLGGLTEATETITLFIVMCLWPNYFSWLAYGFAVLCGITIVLRIHWAYQSFR